MSRKWKKINSKLVYSNPWIKIHEDNVLRPDGKKGIYGYLEKPQGIFIIALDNDDYIYLVNEYRYPLQKSILQLPAGTVDDNDIVEQAKKELLEETGITATKWERLGGFYVAPGYETTFINVFLATDLNVFELKVDNQDGDELILQIIKIKLSELKKMVVSGKIECGITIAALNLFFLNHFSK
ncbi:NUDIX hydrolase [Patescibacteria group bacterium]|nr:NUDIX hydrolase [Patescibacteria group bacterium]